MVRACGPEEPRMGALMQNAYGKGWIGMNLARKVRQQVGATHTAWHATVR